MSESGESAATTSEGAATESTTLGGETESTVSTETTVSWRDGLPADMRDNPALQSFGGIPDLAKSYLHGQELIGAKGVIPPKNDSPEELNRFYSELGRPDDVGGYDLGDFAPPENLPWDADLQTSMLESMHAAGLTDKQVNGVIRAFAQKQGEQYSTAMAQLGETTTRNVESLKTEWGVSFDANVDLAKRMFKHAFGKDHEAISSMAFADGSLVGNNPTFIKAMAKIGKGMKEDTLRGDETPSQFTKAPHEAKEELSQLAIDEKFQKVLWDREHPEHQRAVAKQAALFDMAYPEEAVA